MNQGDSLNDVTDLRVRVLDADGRAVTEGQIECYAGPRQRPEMREDALHTVQTIRGEVTHITLPAKHTEAVLIASGTEGPPTVYRAEWIRHVDGTRQRTGLVERDVVIELTLAPGVRSLRGNVSTDGIRRIPEGLKLLVEHDTSAGGGSVEQLLELQPSLAAIDRVRAAYSYRPLVPSVHGMWVTSEETVPAWLPLAPAEADSDMELNLDLRTGTTLHLTCIDQDTGSILPGVCLEVHALVETSRTGRTVTHRSHTASATTDENGQCSFRGIPSSGVLRVSDCERRLAPGSDNIFLKGSNQLLELALTSDQPAELWEEVRLRAGDAVPTRVWGELPSGRFLQPTSDASEHSTPLVRYALHSELNAASAHRTAQTGVVTWEARVTGPDTFAFWVESAGRRISSIETLWVANALELGPVHFDLRPFQDLELRWRGAPAGSELTISALTASGSEVLLPKAAVQRAAGELRLEMDQPFVLGLDLAFGERDLVRRQWDWDPAATSVMDIELSGSRAVPVEFQGPPAVEAAAEEVVLFATEPRHGERPLRARIELAGGSSRPIPLPPGEYFYRINGPVGAVCGFLRVDTGRDAPIRILWNGELEPRSRAQLAGSQRLVIDAIGERSLHGEIDEALRTFSLPAQNSVGDDRIWLSPSVTAHAYR